MPKQLKGSTFALTVLVAALRCGMALAQGAGDDVRVDASAKPADVSSTTSSCPFTDPQLALQRDIITGRMVPRTGQAKADGRIDLTIREMNEWRLARYRLDALSPPSVRLAANGARWKVFVAVFDGTWNDKDDPSLPITVPGQLANDLATLSGRDQLVQVHYYEGVGTREGTLARLWHGMTGGGTVERAERALADYRAAMQGNGGEPLYLYVIGFSRGAASARHFMNLVNALRSSLSSDGPPDNDFERAFDARRIRSSALLFDTVATGQLHHLDLSLPASNEFALQIVIRGNPPKGCRRCPTKLGRLRAGGSTDGDIPCCLVCGYLVNDGARVGHRQMVASRAALTDFRSRRCLLSRRRGCPSRATD
jgi:hypothetical protein